jgi:hypothetical protein
MKWIWFALAVSQLPARELPLMAGTARVELTPAESMEMYGYANRRCGPSNGVHDPLFAKVLVLRIGESKLALVTLDLGSFVSPSLPVEIRQKLGIPTTLLAASHTHSAPSRTSAFQSGIDAKILDAVKRAGESMIPASLRFGSGSLQLGYNRLVMRDDGRARAMFDNPERIPLGPVDPEYSVLRVDDTSGNAKAILVHYAVHAVVLGPSNCKYSADFPGVLQAKVESEFGGVQAMFVQGGAGDVNPLFLARSGDEVKDFAVVAKMGETLAASVIRTARAAKPTGPIRHPVEARAEVLRLADRWDPSKSLEGGITTVLINREIAIAASPGEFMHKLQTMWKREAGVPYPLFYGYTYSSGGEWLGYVPDLRTAAHGGYGADVQTRVEIGAGERIMQRHLIHLHDMLGNWRSQPGQR